MSKSYHKYKSNKIIEDDLALMHKTELENLRFSQSVKEASSFLLTILNVMAIYPDSFCNPLFVYIIMLFISSICDGKSADQIVEDNIAIQKIIYKTLLPSLIALDTELSPGDFYLYETLISDIKKEGTLQDIQKYPRPERYNFNELNNFLNQTKDVLQAYLDAGYAEYDPEIEDIKQLIIGFITEIPHYENKNAYYTSLNEAKLRLLANQRKKKTKNNASHSKY